MIESRLGDVVVARLRDWRLAWRRESVFEGKLALAFQYRLFERKKTLPYRTLQKNYAYGLIAVLWRRAFCYERGTPVVC